LDPAEFKKILVIHFGQLGDVVLGLPAMRAIRQHFRGAHLTVMVGRSAAEVAGMANIADDLISVDRVALRDGQTFSSIASIFRLVRDVRSRRFDLVIDLHSLSETNLLGYLSGARYRLYARRENRTIEWLNNYPIKPLPEDKKQHHVDRFLRVIEPLATSPTDRRPAILLDQATIASGNVALEAAGVKGVDPVGLFIGAGHISRRWPLDNFVELARLLKDRGETVLILAGPEERDLRPGLQERFGDSATVIDETPLRTFLAVLSRLNVLVTGDTGPMHLAAAVGAGIVMLSEVGAPDIFWPVTDRLVVIRDRPLAEVSADAVDAGILRLLGEPK